MPFFTWKMSHNALGRLLSLAVPVGTTDSSLLASLARWAMSATLGFLLSTILAGPAYPATAGPIARVCRPWNSDFCVQRPVARDVARGCRRGFCVETRDPPIVGSDGEVRRGPVTEAGFMLREFGGWCCTVGVIREMGRTVGITHDSLESGMSLVPFVPTDSPGPCLGSTRRLGLVVIRFKDIH